MYKSYIIITIDGDIGVIGYDDCVCDSSGTGRSGTLLAIDMGMRGYDDWRTVNVTATVERLREQRAGMVQTRQQFIFIYKVQCRERRRLGHRAARTPGFRGQPPPPVYSDHVGIDVMTRLLTLG